MHDWNNQFPVAMAGGLPVVAVPAEIDYQNAAQLLAALVTALGGGPVVIVDMTVNELCDSSGLARLLMARTAAEAAGGEIRLVMDGTATRRVFKVTGADRYFRVFGDLPEAVSASPSTAP